MSQTTTVEKRKYQNDLYQWEKLSKILDVRLEKIYEPEETVFIVCKDQSTGIGINNIYTIPECLIESQRKYITKLEEEITKLKEENQQLKNL